MLLIIILFHFLSIFTKSKVFGFHNDEAYECDIIHLGGFPQRLFHGDEFTLNGDFISGHSLINEKRFWVHTSEGILLYWSNQLEVEGGMWVLDGDMDASNVQAYHLPTLDPSGQWWAFDATEQIFVAVSIWIECPVCKTMTVYGNRQIEGHYVPTALSSPSYQKAWAHIVDKDLELIWDTVSCQYYVVHSTDDGASNEITRFGPLSRLVDQSKDTLEDGGSKGTPFPASVVCSAAGTSAQLFFMIRQSTPNCSVTKSGCLDLEGLSDGVVYSTLHENVRIMFGADQSISVPDLPLNFMFRFEIDHENSEGQTLTEAFLHGGLVRMNIAGTHVLNVCLYQAGSAQNCLVEKEITYDITNTQAYLIHSAGGTNILNEEALLSFQNKRQKQDEKVKLMFLADGREIDGVKTSMLNLMRNLPQHHYSMSTLDLTCDIITEDSIFHHTQKIAGIQIFRICSSFEKSDFTLEELNDPHTLIYQELEKANIWEKVDNRIKGPFEELYILLQNVDILVLSNSGMDSLDAIVEVARLAGVKARLLDVGALGPTVTLRTSALTAVLAQSQYVATHPALVSRSLPVFLLHPVVDSTAFTQEAVAQRCSDSQLGIKESGSSELSNSFHVGFVGRLSPGKGPGLFVRAVAKLRKRVQHSNISIKASMVGSGMLQAHMEKLSEKLHADIEFLGSVRHGDVPCHMRLFDALVVPSLYAESFGMVIIEAMLLGIPVVSFGIGGTAEYLWHGETGLVAREQTPKSLVYASFLLVSDASFRQTLGANAKRIVSSCMSVNRTVSDYDVVFKKLVLHTTEDNNNISTTVIVS